MNIKQVNIVCFSATQTTRRIAEAIASAFDAPVKMYDTTLCLGELEIPTFGPDELVIAGAPVYSGRIPGFVEDFFKGLRGQNTPAIPLAVYGNRDFDDALLELADYLQEGGFALLSAGAFVAEHSFGPEIAGGRPDRDDLQKARDFGAEAKAKLDAAADTAAFGELAITGNRPYKERPPLGGFGPDTSDACTYCGICVVNCPMHIIDAQEPSEIDVSKCIRCNSCVKKCPVNAKSFSHEKFLAARNMLATKFSARREPVYFI